MLGQGHSPASGQLQPWPSSVALNTRELLQKRIELRANGCSCRKARQSTESTVDRPDKGHGLVVFAVDGVDYQVIGGCRNLIKVSTAQDDLSFSNICVHVATIGVPGTTPGATDSLTPITSSLVSCFMTSS